MNPIFEKLDLAQLRDMIDEKDAQIRQLLIDRTEIVLHIGDTKKQKLAENEKLVAFRPAREAMILRNILSQKRESLPASVLIAIWREMISSFCYMQSEFSISYWGDNEPDAMRDMVRYYFGHTAPVKRCHNVTAVLQHLSENKSAIGIVPIPDSTVANEGNWWRYMASEIKVSGIMPFVRHDKAHDLRGSYYILSKSLSEPTGDDMFVLHIKTILDVSRMSIVSYLQNLGYKAQSLAIYDDLEGGIRQHLLDVSGYISTEQEKEFISKMFEISDKKIKQVDIIGQYPAIYDLEKTLEIEPV